MRELPELRRRTLGLLYENPVQCDDVEVRIEPKVGIDSLHGGNCPALELAASSLGAPGTGYR